MKAGDSIYRTTIATVMSTIGVEYTAEGLLHYTGKSGNADVKRKLEECLSYQEERCSGEILNMAALKVGGVVQLFCIAV